MKKSKKLDFKHQTIRPLTEVDYAAIAGGAVSGTSSSSGTTTLASTGQFCPNNPTVDICIPTRNVNC